MGDDGFVWWLVQVYLVCAFGEVLAKTAKALLLPSRDLR